MAKNKCKKANSNQSKKTGPQLWRVPLGIGPAAAGLSESGQGPHGGKQIHHTDPKVIQERGQDQTLEENGSKQKEDGNRRTIFSMGNGVLLDDPMEAAEYLLQREYPEIANETLAAAVFAPDFFVSGTPKVLQYPEGKQKEGLGSQLTGEHTERKLFGIIKEHFKDCKEPAFVLHSYKYSQKTSTKVRHGEIDFVIVYPRAKTIAIFEVKTTMTPTKQLNPAEAFLRELLPNLSDWFLFKGLPHANTGNSNIACFGRKALPFNINNFSSEWNSWSRREGNDLDMGSFRYIVRQLLFNSLTEKVSFICGKSLVTSQVERNFKESGEAEGVLEKVLFLTSAQRKIILENEKMVFLQSDFGTGKTIVLREKAILAAKNNPRDQVYFVNVPSIIDSYGFMNYELREASEEYAPTLLDHQLRHYFRRRGAGNITVLTFFQDDIAKIGTPARSLKKLLESNEGCHFFIDEFRSEFEGFFDNDADSFEYEDSDDAEGKLDAKLVKANTLFIAGNYDVSPFKIPPDFLVLELKTNWRNCKKIMHSAEANRRKKRSEVASDKAIPRVPDKLENGRVLSKVTCEMAYLDREKDMRILLATLDDAYTEMFGLTHVAPEGMGKEFESTSITLLLHDVGIDVPEQAYRHFKEKLGEEAVFLFVETRDSRPDESFGRDILQQIPRKKMAPLTKGNISSYLDRPRGLLITDMGSSQGMEFTNVILVSIVHLDMLLFGSSRNAKLRAVVNLKEIWINPLLQDRNLT